MKSPILYLLLDAAETAERIMRNDLFATFERLQGRVGHIPIAVNPGCHRAGMGEINHDVHFRQADELADRISRRVTFLKLLYRKNTILKNIGFKDTKT